MLWILAETVRRDEGQPQAHGDSLDFAASDFTKSALSLSIWFVFRQLQGVRSLSSIAVMPFGSSETHLETCNVPFHEHGQGFPISRSYPNCREPYPRGIVTGNVRSTLSILVVAFVYALRAYTVCALGQSSRMHLPRISHRISGPESSSTLLRCISLSL